MLAKVVKVAFRDVSELKWRKTAKGLNVAKNEPEQTLTAALLKSCASSEE